MGDHEKEVSLHTVLATPTVWLVTVAIYVVSLTAHRLIFAFVMAVVFVFGALYFDRRHPPAATFTAQKYNDPRTIDVPLLDEDDAKYAVLDLFYAPLTKRVVPLIGFFYRDFVSTWWDPLHSVYEDETERLIKTRLNMAVTSLEKTLLNQERNDIVMATMYGLANTLIIHMRECRTLEESQLEMDAYVEENPQSPFAQLLSRREQHAQLRGLGQMMLKRILPASDRESKVLHSMFKEMLAVHLFGNMLNTCSDPDFINGWLVHYLEVDEASAAAAAAPDSGVVDQGDADGIRSLVEKATEDAMAAENAQLARDSMDDASSPRTSTSTLPPSPMTSPVAKSAQPPPPPPPRQRPTLMIYPPGTVGFSVMDISAPYTDPHTMDQRELMFLVQIERPSLVPNAASSEGGGYVITRTYQDFDVFQALLRYKHPRRVNKISLRLPLQFTRTWLGKKTTAMQLQQQQQQQEEHAAADVAFEESNLAHGLEVYLSKLVRDPELGTEPLIRAFLRKERPTDQGSLQSEQSFADEHQAELAALQQQNQPKSFFSRSFSTAAANNNHATTTSPTASPTPLSTAALTANSASAPPPLPPAGSSSSSLASEGTAALSSGLATAATAATAATTAATTTATKWLARAGSLSSSFSSTASNSSIDGDSPSPAPPSQQPLVSLGSDDEQEDDKNAENAENAGDDGPLPASPASLASPPALDGAEEKKKAKPLSAMDTELLIETTYALIVEIFELGTTTTNKGWMRRSILNLLREIVRRSYTEWVGKQYDHYMEAYLSPDALVGWADMIHEKYWPNGTYNTAYPRRSAEDKARTKDRARQLLTQQAVPAGVKQLLGDQNTTLAMHRIWLRLQDENLNRVLVLQVMERVIKSVIG
ncbi:PXA domain-containing protein [Gongronella butleri]|nr:PXA domain-containing protein [Gongronella butleri]